MRAIIGILIAIIGLAIIKDGNTKPLDVIGACLICFGGIQLGRWSTQ